jgi:hypothetical protein
LKPVGNLCERSWILAASVFPASAVTGFARFDVHVEGCASLNEALYLLFKPSLRFVDIGLQFNCLFSAKGSSAPLSQQIQQ